MADNNCLLYCDDPCSLLIVWGLDGPLGPWTPGRCTICTPVVPPLMLRETTKLCLAILLGSYIYPKITIISIPCNFFFTDYIVAKQRKKRATWSGIGLGKLKDACSSLKIFKRKPEKSCVHKETDIYETVNWIWSKGNDRSL